MPPSDERTPAQGLARLLLALMVVAAPLVFAAKIGLGDVDTGPAVERPAWAHLVLVTVGRWPAPTELPSGPGFNQLARRGQRIGPVYTAALAAPGPSAVSLWTGRFVANHGVRGADQALPSAAWTLASAARDSGARTGAFLSQPFVTRHGIPGFEQVLEQDRATPDELARAAADFLREHETERRLAWIHIDRPGPDGAEVGLVLDTIQETFAELEILHEALIAFTALDGAADAPAEGRALVPLALELPSALGARNHSASQLSQVDLAGGLAQLMRLPWPNPGLEQIAVQSRTDSMLKALKGGRASEWIWIDTEDGDLLRTPLVDERGLRVRTRRTEDPDGLTEYDLRVLEPGVRAVDQLPRVPTTEEEAQRAIYIEIRSRVLRDATKPVPAR